MVVCVCGGLDNGSSGTDCGLHPETYLSWCSGVEAKGAGRTDKKEKYGFPSSPNIQSTIKAREKKDRAGQGATKGIPASDKDKSEK